jgi:hypothetical protein
MDVNTYAKWGSEFDSCKHNIIIAKLEGTGGIIFKKPSEI